MADKYRKYRSFATVCIGILVPCLAFCLTLMNKFIQNILCKDGAKCALYNQLVDDFTAFFRDDYPVTNMEFSAANIGKLDDIKAYYKVALVICIICLLGIIYSFIFLVRRREYTPLRSGSLMAIPVTGVFMLGFFISKDETISGVKNIVFKANYDIFEAGDGLIELFPKNYGAVMAIYYICLVVLFILILNLVRWLIAYLGRPHEF